MTTPGCLIAYNPDLLRPQDVVAQFTARRPLLARLLDDLRQGDGRTGPQHHLIIGASGMGKTMLLRRLALAVDDDGWSSTLAIGLVWLVDNAGLVFNRIEDDHWLLREQLSADAHMVFVGASDRAMEATFQYESAFYDFFHLHELLPLSAGDAETLLLALAAHHERPSVAEIVRQDPIRMRVVHDLVGENPRALVLLFESLVLSPEAPVAHHLLQVLDRRTPQFDTQVAALAPQRQLIVDAMARHWHPLGAAELAAATGLPVNVASAQLARLVKQGVLEQVTYVPRHKTGFQLADRAFNLWYLMRADSRSRRRLLSFAELLRLHYLHEATTAGHDAAAATDQLLPWHTLAAEAAELLQQPAANLEQHWPRLINLLRQAAESGHTQQAAELVGRQSADGRWDALAAALEAVAQTDNASLQRLAPELRAFGDRLRTALESSRPLAAR